MASPPFNLDINEPTDASIKSAFPSNERTFRDNINSYLNTEHDINTGYHQFQELTTTQKNALTSPPHGMIVYDTTLAATQINTGTSGSPIWINVVTGANATGWFYQFKANGSTTYSATATDTGTLFTSNAAGGTLTITLPNTSAISVGWYGCFMRLTNNMVVSVQGSHSEKIRIAGVALQTTASPANVDGELFILVWDGVEWVIVGASPLTWQGLGSSSFFNAANYPAAPSASNLLGYSGSAFTSVAVGAGLTLGGGTLSANATGTLQGQVFTASGTFTIPSSKIKITVVGAGGGGGGGGSVVAGAAGGAGGAAIKFLTGLTPTQTLTVAVGTGGAAGTNAPTGGGAGGQSQVSSGTATISSITGPGGAGGSPGLNGAGVAAGGAGGLGTGGDLNLMGQTGPGCFGAAGSPGGTAAILGSVGSAGTGGGLTSVGIAGAAGAVMFEWVG